MVEPTLLSEEYGERQPPVGSCAELEVPRERFAVGAVGWSKCEVDVEDGHFAEACAEAERVS